MSFEKEAVFSSHEFEFIGDPKDAVFIKRQFSGITERDLAIETLDIPKSPLLISIIIKAIRLYQRKIAVTMKNRCVFDPSCSHYAEVAFRKKGFLKGAFLTIKRLFKCRPQNGGIDEVK